MHQGPRTAFTSGPSPNATTWEGAANIGLGFDDGPREAGQQQNRRGGYESCFQGEGPHGALSSTLSSISLAKEATSVQKWIETW